jgi:3-methylcrotonyl-CoA carboxylase alpha subunit
MFKKILIANRGEIAVRIMRTCREMGIRTVAVYSDADATARHVREADEAYVIGSAPATQSYLHIEKLLDVAQRSGTEAIHPGYGFLSENADFVEACEQAGIVFIGPPAEAMRLMGSKIAAKQLAQSVGAPIVPGYTGESQEDEVLQQEAARIGFPLLIKASAGGGGKGMREVHQASHFVEQLAGARREALAAFGDETVFLEKLILKPRHIEIQILGDRHGNIIHLGERECSIQRRHQKIVEESPSVALTPALRQEMGAAAVRIAKAAGYVNAGTMEFIFDTDQHFYFLEMNTRLQVEHPVTELVTGLDLVRHQLLIAVGEPLGLTQAHIQQRGHAIEVRLYAEDPQQHFLPSPGTLTRFVQPEGPGVRVDSGVESNDEIPQYYDPMIAKLIVYAEDRPAAIARLERALAQTAIFGVITNVALLHNIACHPAFQAGLTHTGFLAEHSLPAARADTHLHTALLFAALYECQQARTTEGDANPWHAAGAWRISGAPRTFSYRYQEQEHTLLVTPVAGQEASWEVQAPTTANTTITHVVSCTIANNNLVILHIDAAQRRAYVEQQPGALEVSLDGEVYRLQQRQPPDVDMAALGNGATRTQKTLIAPMAGTIVKVQARDGQIVEAQQVLVILSAMKMEHTITAPHDGKVRRITVKEGDVVKGGATLVELE